jgi:hypothetical protein
MAVLIMLPPFGSFLFCIITLRKLLGGGTYGAQNVAAVLGLSTLLPSLLQACGWLLYLQVPAAIVKDLVTRSTRRVDAMENAQCSLSEVMGHVQASHELNTYLSALVAPTITAIAIMAAGFAVVNFGIIYAPREGLYPDSFLQR